MAALVAGCAFGTLDGVSAAEPTDATGRSGEAAAREQLRSMKVADGLEVSLFACEPRVRNPANMDVDARGRVWVTEGANYRVWNKWGRLRPEGDRIVILEDTDGDGKADKETTFYQGNDVNTALGVCVLGNKVIVSCSPNVFVLTDDNGDDKADRKEVLFTGIAGVDHDHGVHAFVFGPDGKLYFNMGNEARELKRPDGSPVRDVEGRVVSNAGQPWRQGLVFRCNLDGTEVEVLGHNFRNNYEVAVDSFGTLWQSDNDDDGNKGVRINYVMEHGNYGYTDEMTGAGWGQPRTGMEKEIPLRHWHLNDPGVVPNLLQTGAGSPTGICVYEGDLLPAVFRNQLIHCDAGPRVVRAYVTEPSGAGYRARIVDILSSEDTWFRPTDVCVAPDGSLFVSDWNDGGVGGHYMADQKLQTMTGRVYHVTPKGHRSVMPKFDFKTPEGCTAALRSPNQAVRYLAWTQLRDLGKKAEPALQRMRKDANPRFQARALALLARLPGMEQRMIDTGLRDTNADLRIATLRTARSLKRDVIPLVRTLAADASPAVRRECALALHHVRSADAASHWAQLARAYAGQDRWYVEALGIGADQQDTAFLAAWLQSVGTGWDTPAGRDIVWRSRGTNTPALLVKILGNPAISAEERPRYLRAMDFVPRCPEKDAALAELALGALK